MAQSTTITIESETPPPFGYEILYRSRAEGLIQFLEKTALGAVPREIQNVVHTQSIRIILKSDIPADGLFIPGAARHSNHLQILIRSDLLTSQNAEQILAHEFFHAIHYLIHPNEKPWIREGLAQFFEYIVLNRFNGLNLASAIREPSTPLEGEYDIHRIVPSQYGHDLQYFYYLWSQCGGNALFWALAQGSPVEGEFGAEGIDRILRSTSSQDKPQCSGFEKSALHFELARIHNKVDYSQALSRDSKIHYLLASTLPGPTPLKEISSTELKKLDRFEPVVLEENAQTPTLLPPGIRRFWLQNSYPYRIQETRPDSSSVSSQGWKQLLIRN